jgi:predicted transposase/invertase (TIGR01784 family)
LSIQKNFGKIVIMSEIVEKAETKLVRFDWAIKNLLRNKANFDVLEGLLSELLKTSVKIEQVLESESNKNHLEDKYNRVDLLAITNQDQRIIIEVQCSRQWDYLSRILYGVSKTVCEHLSEGDSYHQISKIISVSIVFFDLGAGQDYLYKGSTVFTGMHYGDHLSLNVQEKKAYCEINHLNFETPEMVFPEYYIIKVTQFKERVRDKIDEWIYFLKHGKIKKGFSAQGLQMAKRKLDILSLSEEERHAYNAYLESLHDDASFNHMLKISNAESWEEGRIEGRVEGERETRLAIARSLKRTGLADAEIIKHTDLSLEEVKNLD